MPTGIGQRIRRREDPRFLLGRGRYVDDTKIENALYVTFVRSYVAHGTITSIDADEARALPGVQVFTAADLGLQPTPPPPMIQVHESMFRSPMATDRVRYVGEIVAAVVAESREASVDAAELVVVDYDALPAVTDIREVVKDEVLLFEPSGSNTCLRIPGAGDENLFDGCDVVISGSHESPRLLALPIEPRSTVAEFEDGKLTIRLSTQTPHQDKAGIGATLGLEPDQVRVIAPDVGGGFGGKGFDVEDILMGALARATGTPLPLDRDSIRAHGGVAPRPRAVGRLRARGQQGRGVQGPPGQAPAGRRRLPGHRGVPGGAHPDDVQRRLRHPQDRGRHHLGRLQLDADRPGARRRPPGGDPDDRARGGHVRRRGGTRSHRDPPAQLHRQREVPGADRRRGHL